MKKLIRLFVSAALVASFALPALAQTTPATPAATPAAAAAQDDTEQKNKDYEAFRANIKANPQAAYEAGKAYLAKYEAKDGAEDQYIKYIKKWVDSYEKIARRNQLLQQITAKDYNSAFALSKQVLADFPDDLPVLYELSKAGLFAATNGNKANNADAVTYAKRTIQLIQAGKTFEKDKAIVNKDEILGGLNYSLGFFLRESQPTEAANYFINAAQVEGFAKKDPQTYIFLADIYEANEYKNLATQFNNSCKTEDQLKTPECVQLKSKADQVVDHMIDALARAIAYSNSSPEAPKYAQARTAWTETLTNYYKYRNNGSDTGLKELIAGITSKPLPKPGEAVAPMTPSTTTAPSQPSGTPATTTPASTTTAQPNGKAATTQPASKTSSTKTTPKRAHASSKRN
jgi:hypothetical protein